MPKVRNWIRFTKVKTQVKHLYPTKKYRQTRDANKSNKYSQKLKVPCGVSIYMCNRSPLCEY